MRTTLAPEEDRRLRRAVILERRGAALVSHRHRLPLDVSLRIPPRTSRRTAADIERAAPTGRRALSEVRGKVVRAAVPA